MRRCLSTIIIVALAPTTSRGQSAPSSDTLHIEVGSPRVNGRIYRAHVARVLVQRSGPGAAPTSHWTNTLTLGDSAGRPVQRWIQILDIFGTVASVRATMSGWIDYMHMAKVDGRWQIVNVLWELNPPGR